ncbi:MAG: hypothetical protein QM519_04840 [Bacteroidia bacterium]|jgi:hypothetical protein|nr:hypothetical protein [Bacteroidia bacterium]
MATTEIVLNGASIKLQPQPRPVFMNLAATIIKSMYDAPNFGAIISGLLADGLEKKVEQDNPLFQAALWLMHEMGVREFRIDVEAKRMEVDRQLSQEERERDTSDPYTKGNIATGRAVIASVANLRNRTFALNGTIVQVRLQEKTLMEEHVQAVVKSRGVNEDLYSAAMRGLVGRVMEGLPAEDPKVQCAILLLSDLGVRGMRVVKEEERVNVSIEGLNENDAMAAAFLQGAETEQIHQARDRIRNLHKALMNRAQAAAAKAAGTSAPAAAPAPQTVSAAIKRRRR